MVGNAFFNGGTGKGFRWTEATGFQILDEILANARVSTGGLSLTYAEAINDDARLIVGTSCTTLQGASTPCVAYQLQLAQITRSQLIVQVTLPGVTLSSIVNQSFATSVDAVLNGTTVNTRTVADTIDSPAGVAALAAARTQLAQTSGLRRIDVAAPVLVSPAVTTVLSTTNVTTNLPSGTQVTTATVNAAGPATVITGDRGVCATAAANGVDPTGCSLPGTPVQVAPGVLNANVYTNTIQSVTPTTTPTVNQLVSSRWRVAATAGNQFGTSHALVGPAVFDRTDRLQRALLAGEFRVEDAAPVRTASLTGDAVSVPVGPSGWRAFGGVWGEWGSVDADPSVPVARIASDAGGLAIGLERRLGEDAAAGVAIDTGTTSADVRDPLAPERLRVRYTQGAGYIRVRTGTLTLGGVASLGGGTVSTGIATPAGTSTAKRDTFGWGLAAQARVALVGGARSDLALVGGVRYASARLKAFTESGGTTSLAGLGRTTTRTRFYAGTEGATTLALGGLDIVPRAYVRAARDNGDYAGIADVVFASAPAGPVYRAFGPGVNRWSAEVGGGLGFALARSTLLSFTYDGRFRDRAQTHAAKAQLVVRW